MNQRRDRLINFRKANNWLQKDVVLLLEQKHGIKITESYYGMIEQGVRTPSLNIALSIAHLFNVDPNEIFFDVKPNVTVGA